MGKFMRDYRRSRGMTLAEMAKVLGVSIAFVSDVEHGRRSVSSQMAASWGAALDCRELSALAANGKLERKVMRAPVVPRCPLCGVEAEVTARGNVAEHWAELFGHRDAEGEPCRGPTAAKKVVNA